MEGNPDHSMHKNRLQEYTQKSALPLPIYRTVNEGFTHAPKFRSTVLVDGKEYTSKLTFSQRKSAEQDVANFAFECISKEMNKTGFPIIHQDSKFSKSIMNEFAFKINMKRPSYRTTSADELGSVFVSAVSFNGETYTGEVAGSKKMAEEVVARKAIQSLLGSDLGFILAQIIKSKAKHSSSLRHTVQAENTSGHVTNTPKSNVNLSYCRGIMDQSNSEGKHRLQMDSREVKRMKFH